MLRFACPTCKKALQAPDDRSGQTVSCPDCGAHIRVPASPAAPAPAAPEENPFAGLDAPPGQGPVTQPAPGADYPSPEGDAEWRPNLEGGEEPPDEAAEKRPGRWPPEVEPLGRVYQVHVGRRWPQILLFVGAVLVAMCSFCCISPVLSLLVLGVPPAKQPPGAPPTAAPRPPPTVAEEVAGSLILAFGSLVFVGAAVGLFFLGRRFGPPTILVCHEGLAVVRGRSADVCLWKDVRAVWQSVVRTKIIDRFGNVLRIRTSFRYTVEREHGKRLVFDNSSSDRIQRLGNTIQNEATRCLLPLAYDAVVRDRRVISFDPFGVGFDGVRYAGRMLPWEEVGALMVRSGLVRIHDRRARQWAVVKTPQIANLHVFLNIVENLSGKRWQ